MFCVYTIRRTLVGGMVMNKHFLLTAAFVGTSFLLAGCQPQSSSQTSPSPSPVSMIPSSVPETTKIQTDICGKLPTSEIATITGVKVDPPAVTTTESITGAKRHTCVYSRAGAPEDMILKVTVSFKSETTSEAFQQLWSNQQQAQQQTMQSLSGVGTEAFISQTSGQPVLYMLVPDAQYWIQMGTTTQSAQAQSNTIEKLAKAIAN